MRNGAKRVARPGRRLAKATREMDGSTDKRMLAVCQVEDFGPPELGLIDALTRLCRRGWQITVTTPTDRPAGLPDDFGWAALELGGLAHGAGARAVASWPRARRLAREHDLVYLNGSVAGRLIPALRTRPVVLHIHDMVRRVPRHWLNADLVLADSRSAGIVLDPLEVHVVGSPVAVDEARSGADTVQIPPAEYAELLHGLLDDVTLRKRRVASVRLGSS